jgi:hypothetical protein
MKTSLFLARGKTIATRARDAETTVMSATGSKLFTLNEVASVISKPTDGTMARRDIVAREVCTKYDVALHAAPQAEIRGLTEHGVGILSRNLISVSIVSSKANR